jgi:6-phosphogluconolactonase (cycloisomerase 2 family)
MLPVPRVAKSSAIDAAGSAKPYVKVSESIVSAMACDASGRLYLGTSGSGKVYRVDNGTASLVFDSNQAHITALNYSERENKLYVGTAEKGCVYSLDANLQVKAEFETGEHIVTGIAKDKAGNLFVTTAGAGKLFRVQANGQAEPVAISDAFYTLYYDSHDDRVYSGDAEGDITRVEIDPVTDQAQFIPVCHTEQEAVMALSSDGGKLFSGSSNVAQVRTFEIQPSGDPTYSSIVQDAQRPANWSRAKAGQC